MECVTVSQQPVVDPQGCDLVIGSKCELGFENSTEFMGYSFLDSPSPSGSDCVDSQIGCLSKSLLLDVSSGAVEDDIQEVASSDETTDKLTWPCCAEDNLHLNDATLPDLCSQQEQKIQQQQLQYHHPETSDKNNKDEGQTRSCGLGESVQPLMQSLSDNETLQEKDHSEARSDIVIQSKTACKPSGNASIVNHSLVDHKLKADFTVKEEQPSGPPDCEHPTDRDNFVISNVWSEALPIPVPVNVKDKQAEVLDSSTYSKLRGLATKLVENISKENTAKTKQRKRRGRKPKIALSDLYATALDNVKSKSADTLKISASPVIHHYPTTQGAHRDRTHLPSGMGSISQGIPMSNVTHNTHIRQHTPGVFNSNTNLHPTATGNSGNHSQVHLSKPVQHIGVNSLCTMNYNQTPIRRLPVKPYNEHKKQLEAPPWMPMVEVAPTRIEKVANINVHPPNIWPDFQNKSMQHQQSLQWSTGQKLAANTQQVTMPSAQKNGIVQGKYRPHRNSVTVENKSISSPLEGGYLNNFTSQGQGCTKVDEDKDVTRCSVPVTTDKGQRNLPIEVCMDKIQDGASTGQRRDSGERTQVSPNQRVSEGNQAHKTKSGMKLKSYWKDLHESKDSSKNCRKRGSYIHSKNEDIDQKKLRETDVSKTSGDSHLLHGSQASIKDLSKHHVIRAMENSKTERISSYDCVKPPAKSSTSQSESHTDVETPLPQMPPLIPIYSLFSNSNVEIASDRPYTESFPQNSDLTSPMSQVAVTSTTGCLGRSDMHAVFHDEGISPNRVAQRHLSDTSVPSGDMSCQDRWTNESPASSIKDSITSPVSVKHPLGTDTKSLGVHLALQYRLWKNFMDFGVNQLFHEENEDRSSIFNDQVKLGSAFTINHTKGSECSDTNVISTASTNIFGDTQTLQTKGQGHISSVNTRQTDNKELSSVYRNKDDLLNKNNCSNAHIIRGSDSNDSEDGKFQSYFPLSEHGVFKFPAVHTRDGPIVEDGVFHENIEENTQSLKKIDNILIDIIKTVKPGVSQRSDSLSVEQTTDRLAGERKAAYTEDAIEDVCEQSRALDKTLVPGMDEDTEDESNSSNEKLMSPLHLNKSEQFTSQSKTSNQQMSEYPHISQKREVDGDTSEKSKFSKSLNNFTVEHEHYNESVANDVEHNPVFAEVIKSGGHSHELVDKRKKVSHVPLDIRLNKAVEFLNCLRSNLEFEKRSSPSKKLLSLSSMDKSQEVSSLTVSLKQTVPSTVLPVRDTCKSIQINSGQKPPQILDLTTENYGDRATEMPSHVLPQKSSEDQAKIKSQVNVVTNCHSNNTIQNLTVGVNLLNGTKANGASFICVTEPQPVTHIKNPNPEKYRGRTSPKTMAKNLIDEVTRADRNEKSCDRVSGFIDSVYSYLMKSFDKIQNTEDNKKDNGQAKTDEDQSTGKAKDRDTDEGNVSDSQNETSSECFVNNRPITGNITDAITQRYTGKTWRTVSDVTDDVTKVLVRKPKELLRNANASVIKEKSNDHVSELVYKPPALTAPGQQESSAHERGHQRDQNVSTDMPLDMTLGRSKTTGADDVQINGENQKSKLNVMPTGSIVNEQRSNSNEGLKSIQDIQEGLNLNSEKEQAITLKRKRQVNAGDDNAEIYVNKKQKTKESLSNMPDSLCEPVTSGPPKFHSNDDPVLSKPKQKHSENHCKESGSKPLNGKSMSLLDFRFKPKKIRNTASQEADGLSPDSNALTVPADMLSVTKDISGDALQTPQTSQATSSLAKPVCECNFSQAPATTTWQSKQEEVSSLKLYPQGILVPYKDFLKFVMMKDNLDQAERQNNENLLHTLVHSSMSSVNAAGAEVTQVTDNSMDQLLPLHKLLMSQNWLPLPCVSEVQTTGMPDSSQASRPHSEASQIKSPLQVTSSQVCAQINPDTQSTATDSGLFRLC